MARVPAPAACRQRPPYPWGFGRSGSPWPPVAALPMALTNPRRRTVALGDLADVPVRLPPENTAPPWYVPFGPLAGRNRPRRPVTHDLIAAAREASSRRLVSATNQNMRPPTCEGKLQRRQARSVGTEPASTRAINRPGRSRTQASSDIRICREGTSEARVIPHIADRIEQAETRAQARLGRRVTLFLVPTRRSSLLVDVGDFPGRAVRSQ